MIIRLVEVIDGGIRIAGIVVCIRFIWVVGIVRPLVMTLVVNEFMHLIWTDCNFTNF